MMLPPTGMMAPASMWLHRFQLLEFSDIADVDDGSATLILRVARITDSLNSTLTPMS